MMVNQKPRKIVPMRTGRSFNDIPWNEDADSDLIKAKAVAAEPTGKGNLLIIDGYFGRMFRSSEKCVRDEIDEYCKKYREICQRLDEDPAHQYYEVMNWNDLYDLHGIVPGIAQDQWGYSNSEDYRVQMDFKIDYVSEGPWVEKFGEPYLYYEPMEWCYPDPCYMEV